jgi:hypothetical protein
MPDGRAPARIGPTEGGDMSTISREPSAEASDLARRPSWIGARNMWASLAIVSMWLVVLVTTMFAPDFESWDVSGTHTVIPSGIVIALFALFGTMSVAKWGFERKDLDS